jgi:hypothetical protein
MIRPLLGLACLALVGGFLVSDATRDEEPTDVGVFETSWAVSAPDAPATETPDFEPVQPAQPSRLVVTRLGIDAIVLPVGMADASTMEVPSDISTVGWFLYGSTPSDYEGSTVLVGHRDGVADPNGVFRELGDLKIDERITIVDSAGATWTYRVDNVEALDLATFAKRADRIFDYVGEPRLVLLTCGGDYNRSNGGYQATIVVTASPQ